MNALVYVSAIIVLLGAFAAVVMFVVGVAQSTREDRRKRQHGFEVKSIEGKSMDLKERETDHG